MMTPQNNSMEAIDGLTREELGNLVKYATGKIKITRKQLIQIGISDDILALMKNGQWAGKQAYISLFALILRHVVPQTMKFEHSLSRERIEQMKREECSNLREYKDFLLEWFIYNAQPPTGYQKMKEPKKRIKYICGLRKEIHW